LGQLFRGKRIFDRWEPLRLVECAAAIGSVGLNAGVSLLGWWLWKCDVITISVTPLWVSLIHCVAMTLFMDVGMYFFHRLAHHPILFKWIHSFHHRHEVTNPISLFVLHPVEVLGFGMLMMVYLMVVPVSMVGLVSYLTLNVLWGTLGHSGVEPLPAKLLAVPIFRLIGTSTFHAEHHEHLRYNFGFYTLFWDQVFGTLDPEYEKRFRQES
jgi:Delta7-sterol 5-desaturase